MAYARTPDRSRSPRRGVLGLFTSGSKHKSPSVRRESEENPEEKMHKWAEKSGSVSASHVKELMDTMQIADFEKFKMVAVFKCPRSMVAEKIRLELGAKTFPEEVVAAVTDGMGEVSFYEKIDSHFEHESKTGAKGKSNLYQYAVWGKACDDDHIEVSVWCITTKFKKGSTGSTTKSQIEGLKQFMEQETRTDVLQIAPSRKMIADGDVGGAATGLSPKDSMVAYAKAMHAGVGNESLHEDELINRMEITGFEKYMMSSSFKCPKEVVAGKVTHELKAKKFPDHVIHSVVTGMPDMAYYKKMDEDFVVHANDGRSTFHKYAIWCSLDHAGEMTVSMVCVAASFKKKSEGPVTKSEIEVLGGYLGKEACVDVLKVHAPDSLQ
eukprot:CAMPEP_0117471734 /NCGR_PEP_ID=MMETSP0784-20121206/7883_1 /TAXON_ID=39447 /ORGANISM="" /LENGTH=380 /DNA_ID=CAMNT_0005265861 /DNA_START=15 /DNA_END=1157 /DNA_ORIENTATION=-